MGIRGFWSAGSSPGFMGFGSSARVYGIWGIREVRRKWESRGLWGFKDLGRGGQDEVGELGFMGFWEFSPHLWDFGNLALIYGISGIPRGWEEMGEPWVYGIWGI